MQEEKNYCVYKHTSPSNKVYIGITRQEPEKRWRNGNGYKRNEYFFNAIKKYGFDNFTHEILFTNLTKEEACEKEIELIAFYKSNQRDFGYNNSPGGESPFKGLHLSEDTKRKMSISHIGLTRDENYRHNISVSKMGSKNGMFGKTGASNHNSKTVIMYDLNNNELNRFASMADANRELGLPEGAFKLISACCRCKRKTAYGYIWRYADAS